MMKHLALLIVFVGFLCTAITAKPTDDGSEVAENEQIQIDLLGVTFSNGKPIACKVTNKSGSGLLISVAVEGKIRGQWREIENSVGDRRGPSPKVTIPKTLRPGRKIRFEYMPWPVAKREEIDTLRWRVDVWSGSHTIRQIRSEEISLRIDRSAGGSGSLLSRPGAGAPL